jgi:hypothetical protein
VVLARNKKRLGLLNIHDLHFRLNISSLFQKKKKAVAKAAQATEQEGPGGYCPSCGEVISGNLCIRKVNRYFKSK